MPRPPSVQNAKAPVLYKADEVYSTPEYYDPLELDLPIYLLTFLKMVENTPNTLHARNRSHSVTNAADLLKDDYGRYIDTRKWSFAYSDLDKEVEQKTMFRYLYGPGIEGPAFRANFMNVWRGTMYKSGHHGYNDKVKDRDMFIYGQPPKLGFCVEIVSLGPDKTEAICGNQFTVLSQGCTEHTAVNGRQRNEIFMKLKRGDLVYWRDVLLPSVVEKLEEDRAEETRAERADAELQAIEEQAEAEGCFAYEILNKRNSRDGKSRRRRSTMSDPDPASSPASGSENTELERADLTQKAYPGFDARKSTKARIKGWVDKRRRQS